MTEAPTSPPGPDDVWGTITLPNGMTLEIDTKHVYVFTDDGTEIVGKYAQVWSTDLNGHDMNERFTINAGALIYWNDKLWLVKETQNRSLGELGGISDLLMEMRMPPTIASDSDFTRNANNNQPGEYKDYVKSSETTLIYTDGTDYYVYFREGYPRIPSQEQNSWIKITDMLRLSNENQATNP